MLLSVRDVTLRFGGIVALDGVSFEVDRGVVAGLIGPNGAGKTTVFNVITRLYTPDSGEVELDGDALGTPPTASSAGHRADVPEHQPVQDDERARNVLLGGHALGRQVGEARLSRRSTSSGSRIARDSRGLVVVRDAEARRDRPRVDGAARSSSWTSRRRPQPRGGRGARRLRRQAPRRAGAGDPARRAPHDPRDAGLRPRQRPELRAQDRLGTPAEVQAEPAGSRRTSGWRSERSPRARRRRGALRPVQALRGISLEVPEARSSPCSARTGRQDDDAARRLGHRPTDGADRLRRKRCAAG